ncbi:MAG: hypothetical protein K6T73_10025 [Candidatus Bathyarchaeota archaeon]|nr:hypothetical protein [Candidatus Bathyarchaeota archaeon]
MIKKLKGVVDSYWKRSKAFRIIIIAAFFLSMAVPIFLLAWHARLVFGYSFAILIIMTRLVFGYVARKEGYAKQISLKQRRLVHTVTSGLLTGFTIMIIWREFSGHPLPSYSFPLFLALIIVGAFIGDKGGKKLKMY